MNLVICSSTEEVSHYRGNLCIKKYKKKLAGSAVILFTFWQLEKELAEKYYIMPVSSLQ